MYKFIFQMNISNLAVCFGPSLFNMGGAVSRSGSQSPSPRRTRKLTGIPDAREIMEQKAAHECLTTMIEECQKIFTVSFILYMNLVIIFVWWIKLGQFILSQLTWLSIKMGNNKPLCEKNQIKMHYKIQ